MIDPETSDEKGDIVIITVAHPTMGTMEFVVKEEKCTDVSINHCLN